MTESREQLLLSRVTDGGASDLEWRELESLADADPKLWRQLAEVQRDHIALMNALGGAMTIAETVTIPNPARPLFRDEAKQVDHIRLNRFGAWTGWAVAALVTIVATVRMAPPAGLSVSGNRPAVQQAGFGTAADAFNAYLQKGQETGQVVGEVPARVLVESRPVKTGHGYEIIFIRQVMERTVVPDLYQINGENELGQPTLTRYVQPVRRAM